VDKEFYEKEKKICEKKVEDFCENLKKTWPFLGGRPEPLPHRDYNPLE